MAAASRYSSDASCQKGAPETTAPAKCWNNVLSTSFNFLTQKTCRFRPDMRSSAGGTATRSTVYVTPPGSPSASVVAVTPEPGKNARTKAGTAESRRSRGGGRSIASTTEILRSKETDLALKELHDRLLRGRSEDGAGEEDEEAWQPEHNQTKSCSLKFLNGKQLVREVASKVTLLKNLTLLSQVVMFFFR